MSGVTPAVRVLRQHAVPFVEHHYDYEERGGTRVSSRELGADEHIIIKTLVMQDEARQPLIVLMHGDREVSTKNLARQIGVKTVAPCDPAAAERHTGYQVGGTSPFGTRKALPLYVERSPSTPLRLLSDAIDAAVASGRGWVLFAPGTYPFLAGGANFAEGIGLAGGYDPTYTTRSVAEVPQITVPNGGKTLSGWTVATEWQQTGPLVWRFKLRPGVKFHDGAPLTADDVVFSVNRARHPASTFSVYANALGMPVAIDPLTVEFRLERVNPVFLQHLDSIVIMNRAWSEAHKVTRPLDFKNKEESFASFNANGTGPFQLVRRQPDQRTSYRRHPAWWGTFEGNVQEFHYTPIANDATRLAALVSGEIDMVLDPAPRDIARLRPRTPAELALAHGIGPHKAAPYGPGLLRVVSETGRACARRWSSDPRRSGHPQGSQ